MKNYLFHKLPWLYSLLIHCSIPILLLFELNFTVTDIPEKLKVDHFEIPLFEIVDNFIDKMNLVEEEIDPSGIDNLKAEKNEEIEYEKKLTQHVSSILKSIYDNNLQSFKTSVLMTLNHEGKILNYKFYPHVNDVDTKSFFDKVIFLASPAPIPPEKYLKDNKVSFLIHLKN